VTDVSIERVFSALQEKVFSFITETENLLKWWGPEGISIAENNLNFSACGPWFSVMVNGEGQKLKVSGQVTSVDSPNSVSFTWGWHDDQDVRGAESHVKVTLSADQSGGTNFELVHRDLTDEEAGIRHNEGWASSLRRLEQFVNS